MRSTILVVDDEAPLLRAMQRVLGKTFDVLSAATGAGALAALTDQVAVVLTDFNMPDTDGLSLAREMRLRGFKGQIAVLSAIVETDELQAAIAAGEVSGLISKPWKSSDLVLKVAELCHSLARGNAHPQVSQDPPAVSP